MERLCQQEVQELKKFFALFDKDGDGCITTKGSLYLSEIKNVMQGIGKDLSQPELQQMVAEFDVDGDGTIDFPQFLNLISKITSTKENKFKLLKYAFDQYDTNGDGFISFMEIRQGMQKQGISITDQQIQEIIEESNKDKDGMLNFQQFIAIADWD